MPYATVADIRAEGVTARQADDARVTALIQEATSLLDKATGQFFEARELDIKLDGTSSRILHLPVPVVRLTGLWPNRSVIPMGADFYEVYSRRDLPDDRANPKIVLRYGYLFERGVRNQRLAGTFWYVEADCTTHPLIRKATIHLVVEPVACWCPGCDARRRRQFVVEVHGRSSAVPKTRAHPWRDRRARRLKVVAEIMAIYKAPVAMRVVGATMANLVNPVFVSAEPLTGREHFDPMPASRADGRPRPIESPPR